MAGHVAVDTQPHIDGHRYACSLVTPCSTNRDGFLGTTLMREEALKHEWTPLFWEVIELVLVHDPTARNHFTPAAG